MASKIKEDLLKRKKELLTKIKPLKKLEEELEEVETFLKLYSDAAKRHGREAPGHPPGCRCYPDCDPSR